MEAGSGKLKAGSWKQVESSVSAPTRLSGAVALATLIAAVAIAPLGIRLTNAAHSEKPLPATYLPALEGPRERLPFEASRVSDLARLNPGYVVIGDSMAGTRIDERRLGELAGRPIAPLLQPGSGSAFWYLALKNWVIDSGIKPRVVFIFFRDTNLTDVLYRLDDQFRWALDLVARDREDELNAVLAARTGAYRMRVRGGLERIYQGDRGRRWMEPALTARLARVVVPSHRKRAEFIQGLNARFSLDHLRLMEAADVQATADADADFHAYVDRSALPLMLRDASRAGVTLCFVRVQRRPIGGRPPAQSRALREYIAELRTYIESHGAVFHDDTGDAALTLDLYEDGDHIARESRRYYTEVFFSRLRPLFQ